MHMHVCVHARTVFIKSIEIMISKKVLISVGIQARKKKCCHVSFSSGRQKAGRLFVSLGFILVADRIFNHFSVYILCC